MAGDTLMMARKRGDKERGRRNGRGEHFQSKKQFQCKVLNSRSNAIDLGRKQQEILFTSNIRSRPNKVLQEQPQTAHPLPAGLEELQRAEPNLASALTFTGFSSEHTPRAAAPGRTGK